MARDVENDPAAAQELAALGFLSVPVVALPGQPPIPGFNPRALAAAINVTDQSTSQSPEALWDSLEQVLAGVVRVTAQLRDADLGLMLPDRDRDLRELIHDVFYKARLWVREDLEVERRAHAQDERRFRQALRAREGALISGHTAVYAKDEARQKADAARYPDVSSLIGYGEASRPLLQARFSPGPGVDYTRLIDTPEGRMTIAEAVSWLVSHSAHHLRQIYWLMENRLRIMPDSPLDLGRLPGGTLPESLW